MLNMLDLFNTMSRIRTLPDMLFRFDKDWSLIYSSICVLLLYRVYMSLGRVKTIQLFYSPAMKKLNFQTCLVVSIIIIRLIGNNRAAEYACDTKDIFPDVCTISEVIIQNDTDLNDVVLPNATFVHLWSPIIHNLSSTLMSRMDAVTNIIIFKGEVLSVYIKATLVGFHAERNEMEEVIIESIDNDQLKELHIQHNQLQFIPDNIKYLKQLTRLHLGFNQIETVNLDLLSELHHLEYVSLNNNKIIRVDTTAPLKLPNLDQLWLSFNRLEDLPIDLWEFPNITAFYIFENKLRWIQGFPEHFPKLNKTSFHDNQWNCGWLKRVDHVLKSRQAEVEKDYNCPSEQISGICCQNRPEDSMEYMMQSVTGQFQRVIEALGRQQSAMEVINEKLQTINFNCSADDLKQYINNSISEVKVELKSLIKISSKLESDEDDRGRE